MYKDQFKRYVKGRYHTMKLVDVPNNSGMRIMTYADYHRPAATELELSVVRSTDIIIARLMAV